MKTNSASSPVSTVLALALIGLALAGCQPRIKTVEKRFVMMDTVVDIRIHDPDKSHAEKLKAIDSAQQRMALIETLTSKYNPTSEVSRFNAGTWKKSITLAPELIDIISQAQHVSEISHGAFDITINPLSTLWGFGYREHLSVPPHDSILLTLPRIKFQNLSIDSNRITLAEPASSIDLGGIAKGYAVDVAIAELQRLGMTDAQVDAGGNLRTISSKLTSGKRNIYVRHPRKHDEFWGRFRMDTGAVATSGDYERYFFQDSVRYHHILDPETGYPGRDCVSVTIQSSTATWCDALSTAIFILGPQRGMELIESMPEVEAIIIFENDSVLDYRISTGMEKIFQRAPFR